jgi:hypothetical protein
MTFDDAILGAFVLFVCACGLFALLGWIADRRREKPLPEPDDPRLRNEFSIREWRRKRDLIECYQEIDHAAG